MSFRKESPGVFDIPYARLLFGFENFQKILRGVSTVAHFGALKFWRGGMRSL
jgi:hypothetical protein